MRAEAVVICNKAGMNPETRRLEIIGLMHELIGEGLPMSCDEFMLFARIVGEPGARLKVGWRCVAPSGQIYWDKSNDTTIDPAGNVWLFDNVRGDRCVFPEAGRYRFIARGNDSDLGETTFFVRLSVPSSEAVH